MHLLVMGLLAQTIFHEMHRFVQSSLIEFPDEHQVMAVIHGPLHFPVNNGQAARVTRR